MAEEKKEVKQAEEMKEVKKEEVKEEVKPFERPRTLLSWNAPGRVYEEKNKLWFLGLGVLVLLLVGIVYLLTEDLWVVLVVLSGGFAFFAMFAVKPVEVMYQIQNTGIVTPGRTFLWEELDSFLIHEEGGKKILTVKTNLAIPGILEILLEGIDSAEVEKAILKYLPYRGERRRDYLSFVDTMASEVSGRLSRIRKPTLPFGKKSATS